LPSYPQLAVVARLDELPAVPEHQKPSPVAHDSSIRDLLGNGTVPIKNNKDAFLGGCRS